MMPVVVSAGLKMNLYNICSSPVLILLVFGVKYDSGGSHQDVISSVCAQARKKKGKLIVMLFTECVYAIWRQRNNKIFTGDCKDGNVVLREILFTVAANCNAVDRKKIS